MMKESSKRPLIAVGAEEQSRELRLAALEEGREGARAEAAANEAASEVRPTSFTSRIENRVPPEFQARSYAVEDAQAGLSPPGSLKVQQQDTSRGGQQEPTQAAVQELLAQDEHLITPAQLAVRLRTSLTDGMNQQAAAQRLRDDGPNVLTPPPKTPAFVKFLKQLLSGFAPILWAAAILCFLAWKPLGQLNGGTPDPLNLTLSLVLVAVIFLQAGFNFYQEYKSDCVMEKLNAMLPSEALVTRQGGRLQVSLASLVKGDLVHLKLGDKVPADLRLISVQDLKLDKSSLTGESEPVRMVSESTETNPMESRCLAFFGCQVVEGTGTGLVIRTGDQTVFGDIAKTAAAAPQGQSGLHKEITRFVWIIVALSLSTGTLAFLGWLFWLRTSYPDFLNLPSIVVDCISLIVAFVPEGMPIAVTVTLALIAKDMAQNKVLVKNLGVVETLGSVSVIASDKTGTLTENRMTVSELSHERSIAMGAYQELRRAFCLCNRARCDQNVVVGDASDSALYRYASTTTAEPEEQGPELLRAAWTKLAELPFNSTNKYMLTIRCIPGKPGEAVLFLKGAPEIVLERCSSIVSREGEEVPLYAQLRKAALASIEKAASQGQRVIGFSRLNLDPASYPAGFAFDTDEPNFPMTNLCFLGWAGLQDPPRAGVEQAIQKCKTAHVRVVMVTGDHPLTGRAIAEQVGILEGERGSAHGRADLVPGKSGDALVLTGADLMTLDEADWDSVCGYKSAVFARTTPKQKLAIVQEYQAREQVVAVTGDGVNDAPALKRADCGVAMGSGSEVSKEAADLIILDDNFSSIVRGIEHGRRCFANLKKVIIYLLPAGSWSEMLPVMASVFLGMPLSLDSFLMIVICCCTDIFPSLAMVYEKPESSLMRAHPRKKTEHLVDWKLLANAYLFIGMIESAAAFTTFFVYYGMHGVHPSTLLFDFGNFSKQDPDRAAELMNVGQSLFFYALVIMQFGNVLTSRTARIPIWRHSPFKGETRNLRIMAAILASAVCVLITCYTPFIQDNLNTRALPGNEVLLLPLGFAVVLVLLNELRKAWAERYPRGCVARVAWG